MLAKIITVALGACFLGACAGLPPSHYWDNPQWIGNVARTVNHDLHYPTIPASENRPSGEGIVEFTYRNGHFADPRMLTSTGSPILDKAIITQIPNIRPPELLPGTDTSTPRYFQLDVGLRPTKVNDQASYQNFFGLIHGILSDYSRYSNQEHLGHGPAWAIANFNYRDGQVIDPWIVASSGNAAFEAKTIADLKTTILPKPPRALRGETLNFQVPFCLFPNRVACDNTLNGMLYETAGVTITSTPARPPCAMISFFERTDAIHNIHILLSSGNDGYDSQVIAQVRKGHFHRTPGDIGQSNAIYKIPVCAE